MKNKILIITTNCDKYQVKPIKTGLWLGELTHFWDVAIEKGFEMDIASPNGGNTPIDPESLKFYATDASIKKHLQDEHFMALLQNTKSIADHNEANYDAIYLTGGHGTMFDFVGNKTLNGLLAKFYENNKIVAAVCHGVCGLVDVQLSNGKFLIENKKITGYSWFEETLAMRKNVVPFNLEAKIKARNSIYKKTLLPLTSFTQKDGNLITGQNPFSTKALANLVVQELRNNKT